MRERDNYVITFNFYFWVLGIHACCKGIARIVKTQLAQTRRFLKDFNIRVIPLSSEIGNLAMSLVEQYALSHDMRSGDALIASTAIDQSQTLCTSNDKHYRQIPLLELQILKP